LRSKRALNRSTVICLREMESNSREIRLPSSTIHVHEFTSLKDEAGAVLWDASLVLSHYLIKKHEGEIAMWAL
jgi:hypothetical protein